MVLKDRLPVPIDRNVINNQYFCQKLNTNVTKKELVERTTNWEKEI